MQTGNEGLAAGQLKKNDQSGSGLDIIIPVGLEDEPDTGKLIQSIIELHKKTGFAKFALSGPSKGWRSVGYPPKEHFLQIAEKIIAYKQALGSYGIECAWWHTLTLKSGPTPWRRIINIDGTPARFSSCPLDPDFRERFASDVALVTAKASPYMIIFEDDFGINCHNGPACFCDLHLAQFAKRTGTAYSREELPEKWRGKSLIKYLDPDGSWEKADFQATPDGVEVFRPSALFDPLYLLFEKSLNAE